MANTMSWDFRTEGEKLLSNSFENTGYVVTKGITIYLEAMKKEIELAFANYCKSKDIPYAPLISANSVIKSEESNALRLHIMSELSRTNIFAKNYYLASRKIIHYLCGNELAMQKRPGISINFPFNQQDVLPIHADTWNGVSPFELNILIPFVDCQDSMCLYILEREAYEKRLNISKGLLNLTSDELYEELKSDLTWIPIKYGEILAFDQSLPHGYSLNNEKKTHWSFNCRFKGLHTPYWDKKLGEYYMPITVKCSTKIGMGYKHPHKWL